MFAYVADVGQVPYPRDDEDWCMCTQKIQKRTKESKLKGNHVSRGGRGVLVRNNATEGAAPPSSSPPTSSRRWMLIGTGARENTITHIDAFQRAASYNALEGHWGIPDALQHTASASSGGEISVFDALKTHYFLLHFTF